MKKKINNLRTLREIKEISKKKINPKVLKWINGSAEHGFTTIRNREIFRSISIIPEVLNNFKEPKIESIFFGKKISSPILIAPVGGLSQFNKKAELIVSEASEKKRIPYFLPNNSSYNLKEINPKSKKKYLCRSLYLDQDLDYCKKNIKEAEEFNCEAITITVDAPVRPVSYNKTDTGYDARKHYYKMPSNYFRKKSSPLTWKNIEFIRRLTNKPLILKGILSKKDAKIADKIGVDAIWISNHGGRQLESDITSVEVLEGIKNNIKSKTKLIVDGGIRTGSDIFKCLALGADYVAIGRPIIFGLIANSNIGVEKVLELYIHELKTTMHLCGVSDINKIGIKNIINRLK